MADGLPFVNLGNGRTAKSIVMGWSGLTSAYACVILDNNTVKCWGRNLIATSIFAGESHTCALLNSTQLNCWGGNGSGQLGSGTTSSRHQPANAPVGLGAEP